MKKGTPSVVCCSVLKSERAAWVRKTATPVHKLTSANLRLEHNCAGVYFDADLESAALNVSRAVLTGENIVQHFEAACRGPP